MIVGVVVGTYSSIFIASPVFLGWVNVARKRKNKKGRVDSAKSVKDSSSAAVEAPVNAAQVTEIPQVERKLKKKRKKK